MIETAGFKGVLSYDASSSVMEIVDNVDRSIIWISQFREGTSPEFLQALTESEVLLHVLEPVTADVIRRASRLRLIHKIGVGLDAIDLAYAKQRGIAVCNMPGTNTSAVAEFALTLMLVCLRRVMPISNDVGKGSGWPARAETLGRLGEISGRTIGLVGYGAVAQRLSKTLAAMGANVIAYDPFVSSADIPLLDLDPLLERSDIVSLHIPLTGETTNLFDKSRLGRMKRGSILINTARGPLVDEIALEEKLRLGHIAAAGLDVAVEEPPSSEHPLRNLENVVMTPHVAWLTDETWRRSIALIVENCRRLYAGSPLLHRVV
jgi:phosphoglycerate dehydrogenase-like enzyme